MTDNLGFGREKRRALNKDILHNRTTFRDAFREMLASVSENKTFEECQEILKKSMCLQWKRRIARAILHQVLANPVLGNRTQTSS